jgi:hypothetical protein
MPHHSAIIHNYYWPETGCTCALLHGDFNFENDLSPKMFVVVLENTGILSPNIRDRVQPHHVKIPANNHTGISFPLYSRSICKNVEQVKCTTIPPAILVPSDRYLKHNTGTWHAYSLAFNQALLYVSKWVSFIQYKLTKSTFAKFKFNLNKEHFVGLYNVIILQCKVQKARFNHCVTFACLPSRDIPTYAGPLMMSHRLQTWETNELGAQFERGRKIFWTKWE